MPQVRAKKQEQFYQKHLVLAQKGDFESQYWVGYCHLFGHGAERNFEEAFAWLQRSADQGSGKALHRLWVCYYCGDGVRGDQERANGLCRESIPLLMTEASNEGDTEAMFLLGLAWRNGQGVPQRDIEQGLKWVQQAAEQGHAKAQVWLGDALETGRHSHFGLEVNRELAFQWFRRAAENEQDDEDGQYNLGRCYHLGIGVEKDWVRALFWYEKCSQGRRALLPVLQRDISIKQSHFQANVSESLLPQSRAPVGMWAHGLAKLSSREARPAGFSPMFVVLKEMVPHLFKET